MPPCAVTCPRSRAAPSRIDITISPHIPFKQVSNYVTVVRVRPVRASAAAPVLAPCSVGHRDLTAELTERTHARSTAAPRVPETGELQPT